MKPIILFFSLLLFEGITLSHTIPYAGKCEKSFKPFPSGGFYNKDIRVQIQTVQKLRNVENYSSREVVTQIAERFHNEQNPEIREELTLTFIVHFKNESFPQTTNSAIYIIGKGLSDSRLTPVFMELAEEVMQYPNNTSSKALMHMIFNPASLQYIREYVRDLSFEEFTQKVENRPMGLQITPYYTNYINSTSDKKSTTHPHQPTASHLE